MKGKLARVRFAGGGGFDLAGLLHTPTETRRGSLLLAHCFTCSKNIRIISYLARGLCAAGFSVLRFDFTGLGDSDGDFLHTTLTTDINDIIAASEFLTDMDRLPDALIGHSFGAMASLLAADQVPSAKGIVMIGSASNPRHMHKIISRTLYSKIKKSQVSEIEIGGKLYPITKNFIDDLKNYDAAKKLKSLNRPLLILHGTNDETVPIAEAEALFATAVQPKYFAPITDADHLFTNAKNIKNAVDEIVFFLKKILR